MKITEKFLNDRNACQEGMEWVAQNKLIGLEPILFLKGLMNGDKNEWANWLIVRVTTQDQKIRYAIYAAEQVIDIYEKNYPNDNRPREAIKVAKKYLKDKSIENKNAAYEAAYAAAYAAYEAAYEAAYAAAYAAYAAAYAAAAATYAAAAATSAAYAAYVATYAAAKKEMKVKILNYGVKLLKSEGNCQKRDLNYCDQRKSGGN